MEKQRRFITFLPLILFLTTTWQLSTAQSAGHYENGQIPDTTYAAKLLEEAKTMIEAKQYQASYAKADSARMIYAKAIGKETKQVGTAFYRMGLSNWYSKQYDQALSNYNKAMEIRLNIFGIEHLETADVYNNIGAVYLEKGASEEAIEYFNKALRVKLKILGDHHTDVAGSYRNLSLAYSSHEKYEEALSALQQSLNIRTKIGKGQEREIASTYNDIGIIYDNIGNYNVGLEYKQKALDTLLPLLGEEHPDVTIIYLNLGSSLYRQGKYDDAISYLEKALSIHLKTLGNEHPTVADSYFNLGVLYETTGNFKNGLNYKKKALSIYRNSMGDNHPKVSFAYGSLGNSYAMLEQYDDAVEYYGKALAMQQKIVGSRHPEVARSYFNLGMVYKLMGQLNESIQFTSKALEIRLEKYGEMHPEVAECYNNLGILFELRGDNQKGKDSYHKTLNILRKVLSEDHPRVADAYLNLGIAYYYSEDYQKAIDYCEKALQIIRKTFGEIHGSTARCYTNLGSAYEKMNNKDKALEYKQKALQVTLKALGESHTSTAIAYNNLGAFHIWSGELDSARFYFQKSLTMRLQKLGEIHPDVASSYLNLGLVHYATDEYEQVLEYLRKSLKACRYGERNLDRVNSFEHLIPALRLMASTYEKQYKELPDPRLIDQSYEYCQRALTAIEHLNNHIEYQDSKVLRQNMHFEVYENLIAVSLEKAKLHDDSSFYHSSFRYAEISKSPLLLAVLKESEALRFAGLPDSLLSRERRLRLDIATSERKRKNLFDKGIPEGDSSILNLSSKVFDLRSDFNQLKQILEVKYPAYYRLKYDFSTATLDYVQDTLLQQGQTLLEYFVGDTSLFVFLIQPNRFEVRQIPKDSLFDQWVEDMTRNGIYGYYNAPLSQQSPRRKESALRNYADAAHRLYQTLIAPVKDQLTEELIIIPDGILGYLPFEALLTERPPRPTAIPSYRYLIEDHQISYCYSATLLREMQDKQPRRVPNKTLLTMAPFYLDNADSLLAHVDTTLLASLSLRDTLAALPATGPETAAIARLLGGRAFFGEEAGIDRFLSEAADYRILHLATHGRADDRVGDYAYLAFGRPGQNGEFDKLYARDLYALSLNADLVVLSACETGIGKLQRGEGIISLARAFAYAGAKSIVTTLWKVSDARTQDLMTNFYKYLKKRKAKDEALRLAKLDFLRRHRNDPELTHPFFWAGFIGIGDMSPVH